MPAPYWAAVSPVVIPLQSCNRAADPLIEWFGPEDLRTVVGGEKWWQVRGMDGIDAEWITEKEYLSEKPAQAAAGRKLSTEDTNILRMEHLDTVMVSPSKLVSAICPLTHCPSSFTSMVVSGVL